MIDSSGRSALGDLVMSALGDFRKGATPTQARIGNTLQQFDIGGPVDTGAGLAFFVDTTWSSGGVIGVMFVAYDFSEISFRVIEGSIGDGIMSQVEEMVAGSVRITFIDTSGLAGFTLDVPQAGNVTMLDSDFTGDLSSRIYTNGTNLVALSGENTVLGVFNSSGTLIDCQRYYNVTVGDTSINKFPFYDGTSVFVALSKGSSHGVLKMSASDPTIASAVTYSAPGTLSRTRPC